MLLLPVKTIKILRAGITHLVWSSIESVAEVKKGVIKARVLTGVYILQSNRRSFSCGALDPTCQFCRLENEDIYHMVTRCPAYHEVSGHLGP